MSTLSTPYDASLTFHALLAAFIYYIVCVCVAHLPTYTHECKLQEREMDLFSVSLGLQQCLAYSHYPVNTSEGGSKGWEAGPAVVKEFGFGAGLQSVALKLLAVQPVRLTQLVRASSLRWTYGPISQDSNTEDVHRAGAWAVNAGCPRPSSAPAALGHLGVSTRRSRGRSRGRGHGASACDSGPSAPCFAKCSLRTEGRRPNSWASLLGC